MLLFWKRHKAFMPLFLPQHKYFMSLCPGRHKHCMPYSADLFFHIDNCLTIFNIVWSMLDDGHLDYYFNEKCEDYWRHFTTNESFSSREEVVTWARNISRCLNMYLVIRHSTNSTTKCYGWLDLRCERSGERGDGVINSKKIGCPFRLTK